MNLPRHDYTFAIPLTQNKQTLVSEKSWYDLRRFKWQAAWNRYTKSYYAQREIRTPSGRTTELMSRRILGLKHGDPLQADHVNHDTLDNRLFNLRAVTQRENIANSRRASKHGTGIQYRKDCPKRPYHVRIMIDGKIHCPGSFRTEAEAQQAYDQCLKEHTNG